MSGRTRRFPAWLLRETREVVVLTGQSIWRGFLEFYNSDDLTYAASVAYARLRRHRPEHLPAAPIPRA